MTKISELPLATSVGQYDLVPIVQNAVTKAARANMFSGGSGTSTTSSAVLTITDGTYGGKGDGVLFTDLTVTAGSKNISSSIGPFTSTAVDAGKIVIWLTGGTTEVGTIATVTDSKNAVLVNNAVASSVAFGGPNGNGAFGTDNTNAINNALTAAQSGSNTAGSSRRSKVSTPRIHFPAGIYLTRALNPITMPNGRITGDGFGATFIVGAIASGVLFQHGTYNSNPADAFQGIAYNWGYQNIHFLDACRISTGTENQRSISAIVDYGCGNIRIDNCRFTGFKYGFAGAHGSDFSDIRDSYFSCCDVGSYFGPGSQQVNISKTDYSDSREGAVFEGAPHWHLGDGSSFEDLSVASITIEGKSSGQTRWNVPVGIGGAFYSGNFIVEGSVWFETNAGGNGRIAPRIIWFNGDGAFNLPAEGLTLRDGYVISGGTQQSGGTNTVIEYNSSQVSDQPVIVDGLYLSDPSYVNSIFRFTGSASDSKPLLKNVRKPSNVALTQGNASGAKYVLRNGSMHGFTNV